MQTLTTPQQNKSFSTPVPGKSMQKPFFSPLKVHPKLTIGAVDDPYEREADAMADKIMRMPGKNTKQETFFKPVNNSIQRQPPASGDAPEPTHEGSPGDVLKAVTAIPQVNLFLENLGQQFLLSLGHTWDDPSHLGKIGIFTVGGSLLAGLGLSVFAARNDPAALDLMSSPLSGTVFRLPASLTDAPLPLRALGLEVNFDRPSPLSPIRNNMVGLHMDVGLLLQSFAPGLGFGRADSMSGMGAPPSSAIPVSRKCANCEEEELQRKEAGSIESGDTSLVEQTLQSSGTPMDKDTKSFMEDRFGHDFSSVKIHTDTVAAKSAQSINALAYTTRHNIVFNSGQYSPGTESGKRLLAHELTHAVQQGSAIIRKNENETIRKQSISRSNPDVIRRGEAPVHRDIELTSLGVSDFTKANQLTPEQQSAAQVYAGNWMRDFSQFNVPKPIKALAGMPKQVDLQGNAVANSGTIGEDGAQEIVYGIIRALAALEFGRDITDQLIIKKNISAYRPQEHIDNPAGMTFSGDVVPQDMSPGDKIPADTTSPATNEYKGASVAGNQLMNSALFSVSSSGLSEHIYNSIEFVKSQLREAMTAGATPTGRMRLGTGLHGVEDYFSHSNFIEVALNMVFSNNAEAKKLPDSLKSLPSYKKGAQGVVDTLFDATVTTSKKGSRQAITTGTFGGTDTQVSIAEVLLPMLPGLITKIDMAIERAFSIVLSQQNSTTWQQLKKLLATDKGGAALVNLLDGIDASGLQLSSITIDKITIGDYWIASGFTPHFSKASEAIINMVNTIKDIKETRDTIKQLPEALVPDAVLNFLKIIDQVIISMKDQIKVRIHETILSVVQQLTGIDARKGLQSGLMSLDKLAADQVEDLTKKSSLQSRLKNPDDDLNKLTTDEKSKVIPSGPLPPSHSEISKDHPDHPSAGGVRTKSLFFDLHRMLAIEADTHIMGLIEKVWQKTNLAASILPSGPIKEDALLSEKLKHEAADISAVESINAPAEGRHFAQKEIANLGAEEIATLNAVDLFISHPADSTWWIPVVESYAKAHATELADDIRLRNLTRGERQ